MKMFILNPIFDKFETNILCWAVAVLVLVVLVVLVAEEKLNLQCLFDYGPGDNASLKLIS